MFYSIVKDRKSIFPLPIKIKYSGLTPDRILSRPAAFFHFMEGVTGICAAILSPSVTTRRPFAAPLTAAVLRLSSPENRKYLNPARQPFPMQEIY